MEEQNKLERLLSALPWVVGGAALILLIAYIWVFHELPGNESPPAWGAFGDYVGGLLNPLVSTFTLIVAVKVWRQQKIEMADTKNALEKQAETAEQQRQEQRFFDLLGLYHSTVASITLVARMSARSEKPVQYPGKEAIAQFFRSRSTASAETFGYFLELGFYSTNERKPSMDAFGILDGVPASLERQGLRNAWKTEETAAIFDHYFRVLFRVLAESENLLGTQHFKYVKLLRAQLSRYELMLIGLNLWLGEEVAKMIPTAEKYGLLKHLPNNNLRKQLLADLPPAVFGRSFAAKPLGTAPTGASPC